MGIIGPQLVREGVFQWRGFFLVHRIIMTGKVTVCPGVFFSFFKLWVRVIF